MSMDPSRLPRNRPAPAAPLPAPVKAAPVIKVKPKKPVSVAVAPVVAAAPVLPALPVPAAPTSGQPFQGLDPLTAELVQSAPLIPVGATAPPSPAQSPVSEPGRPALRAGFKAPTVLVALGGAVAAGLLLITGYRALSGQSAAAGRTSATPIPQIYNPAPPGPSIANLPTPSAWLKAGGS